MRAKGITYDTGFFPGGKNTRPSFDPELVRREMEVIATELRCTAVRVTGGDPQRLSVAAEHAASAGLEVWFSPHPAELSPTELLPYFADCAERAERLRRNGTEVVLVAGCELSFFASGFIPGADSYARMAALMSGDPQVWAQLADVPERMNSFLATTAATVRERFGGRVTYAAGLWEQLDWSPFDIVAVDAYRTAQNAAQYGDELRAQFAHGKPVAVTEFGCCTYRGAADRGGYGWAIIDERTQPPRINGEYVRDEDEQVRYLHDLLAVFEREGVDSAFWFTFAGFSGRTHRPDPRYDLDLASYGVVKMLPDGAGSGHAGLGWEPKASFQALAAAYAS